MTPIMTISTGHRREDISQVWDKDKVTNITGRLYDASTAEWMLQKRGFIHWLRPRRTISYRLH